MASEGEVKPAPTRSRRAAREAALKAAYQIRIGGFSPKGALDDVLAQHDFAPEAADFVRQLIMGLDTHLGQIDDQIIPLLAAGWDFDRLAETDRAVLRLATFELFYLPNVPPKATINEAVTLAKRYGTEDSGRFVNGVLGRMLLNSPKAQWTPPAEPDWDEPDTAAPEEEVEEVVEEGSEAHLAIEAVGPWKLRKNSGEQRT